MKHQFVEFIPNDLEEGTIYVSIVFGTIAHKCLCMCGKTVFTPLSPTDWKLTFDGESISLYPSIGNWSFDCKSHYWIKNNRVIWAKQLAEDEITAGRRNDQKIKEEYYYGKKIPKSDTSSPVVKDSSRIKSGYWLKFKKWLFNL